MVTSPLRTGDGGNEMVFVVKELHHELLDAQASLSPLRWSLLPLQGFRLRRKPVVGPDFEMMINPVILS